MESWLNTNATRGTLSLDQRCSSGIRSDRNLAVTMFNDDIKHAAVDRYRRIASAGIENTPCRESCPTDDPRRRLSGEILQLEAAGMLIVNRVRSLSLRAEPAVNRAGPRHAGVPAHVADGG